MTNSVLFGYFAADKTVVCRHCVTDDDINAGAREIESLLRDQTCSRCGQELEPCPVPVLQDNAVIGYHCECGRFHDALVFLSGAERDAIHHQYGFACAIRHSDCDYIVDGEQVVGITTSYKVLSDVLPEELVDPNQVRSVVQDGLSYQFNAGYSWHQMIDDCNLTDAEKAWAKEHLDYQVVILDK